VCADDVRGTQEPVTRMRRCQIARIGEQMTRPHRRRRVRGFAPSWIIYAYTSSGLTSSQRIVCSISSAACGFFINCGKSGGGDSQISDFSVHGFTLVRARPASRSVRQSRRGNVQKLVGPAGEWPRSIRGASPGTQGRSAGGPVAALRARVEAVNLSPKPADQSRPRAPIADHEAGPTSRQESSGKEDSWKLETFQMEPCG
jgi:hypothetical protein